MVNTTATIPTTPSPLNETQFYVHFESNDQYLPPFQWESFDLISSRRWMGRNWQYSLYISLFYVSAIFIGKALMKQRDAFDLRRTLFYWNFMLATFSLIGFMRTVPEINYIINNKGLHASVCELKDHSSAAAFWGWLMTLSKVVELGDTAFIVLRKQPLLFLHWYHHITVLVYTWSTYEQYDPSKRWFMNMNYFAHSLMYSYYAGKALKIKIPRGYAMVITVVQLSQMFVGVFIELYAFYYMKTQHGACPDRSYESLYVGLAMYTSYVFLFANFFLKSYFGSKAASQLNNSRKSVNLENSSDVSMKVKTN